MQWDKLAWAVAGLITLVEFAPIKINPWKFIGRVIQKLLFGDILSELEKLKKEMKEDKIASIRWRVLDFANSCMQSRKHTREEWEHCIGELSVYENYCAENKIPNGVMEETAKYLRYTYQQRLIKNDFL